MPRNLDLRIVIPVYDDWESVSCLLPRLAAELMSEGIEAEVLLVDDGSRKPTPDRWDSPGETITAVRILRLFRNLGHQRAICVALAYLRSETECQRVLVMDGDGEDDPADVPRLVRELESNSQARIVFAERARRSEGRVFAFFYHLYRALHRLLVGLKVRVGNFSVMNRECLESLCTAPELWNHYAAAAFATRQPMAFVPTRRATRLAGRSTMNFPSLVMHGLSALSVFSDRIATRLLIASSFASLMALVGMIVVAFIRLATGYAIPGWATNAFGIFAILLVQFGTFMLTYCFLILVTRGFGPFIPVRDYGCFVRSVETVTPIETTDS